MQPFIKSLYRAGLIGGAALALSLTPTNARAQQGTTQTTPSTQTEGTRQNPNPDLTTGELASMDQFLDNHEDIERDLRANPSLVNDQNYLNQHTELKSFLSSHPQIRNQFTENPTYFMNRENQREGRRGLDRDRNATNQDRDRDQNATDQDRDRNVTNQDRDRDRNVTDRDREGNAQNPNPDLTNGELASMDQFLDDHKGIDKDLRANPSLVNNQKYLSKHKDLESFLTAHPEIRDQFTENPSFFMNRENRLEGTNRDVDRRDRGRNVTDRDRDRDQNATDQDRDRDRDRDVTNAQNGNVANSNPDRDQDRDRNFTDRDQDRDRDANRQNPNPDLRNGELARMDQFLDDHQQIDKQLTAKPSLINDQKYLAQHKDLEMFMNEHPQVREEFAENPTYFMNRENRFDSRGFGARTDVDPNYSRSNSKVSDKQAKQMDQFLDKHKDIDRDLGKNPSLCNDDKYLKHHKDLRAFLDKNPEVRTEVASNSAYFTQRHERMEQHNPHVNRARSAKPTPDKKPEKTPVEQHETTAPTAPH